MKIVTFLLLLQLSMGLHSQIVNSNVQQLNDNQDIKVLYQNGEIWLSGSLPKVPYHLSIFNTFGRLVYTKVIQADIFNSTHKISGFYFTSGVYLVAIEVGSQLIFSTRISVP